MSRARYHFSGVGGAGMSPLARLMRTRGHAVQGSDRAFDTGGNREAADALRAAGVELVPHDGRGITAAIERFVFSTAVEAETPEMRAARALGLAMVTRPALLAELVNAGRPGMAVRGTSGKSTVTGMVAGLARESGTAAAVMGGAALVGEGGGGCLVSGPDGGAVAAEADESDGTLVGYRPALGLIHNISRDHTELDPLRKQFATFAAQCGRLFVNARCPEASALGRSAGATSYGVVERADAPLTPQSLGPARAIGGLRVGLLRPHDRFCYAEIFYAGGTVTRDLSSRDLAGDIGCAYAEDHAAVVRWVAGEARPGDTVLLMGARDPELPSLARRVLAALA